MDRAHANEFGGMIAERAWTEKNERSSNALGAMMAQLPSAKTWNSPDTRRS
jgi:hypothetical protein